MSPTAAIQPPATDSTTDTNQVRNQTTRSKTPADSQDATGKRKRITGNTTSKEGADSPQSLTADDAQVDPSVKANIVASIMKNMLTVLTEHDPTPSILHHELEAARPTKRVKSNHSSPQPLTIGQQLSQGAYPDFASLLDDIYTVASAITTKVRAAAGKKDGANANGADEVPLVLAKVLLFQQIAHKIATVEQSRRPGIFDQEIPPVPQLAQTQKVCLTVMSQNGPLFSSLQRPTTVSTVPSVTSTPAASPSTAPTSLQASPVKGRSVAGTEVAVVQPIPESALPVSISATKITAQPSKPSPTKTSVPVKTFGENFAPPPHVRPIAPPTKGTIRSGLSWGGKRLGGLPPEIVNEAQTRTGIWLSYKNDTPDTRGRFGSLVGANPLPKEFVAAYTSFAPTRDDSSAGVPSSYKQMVWWSKIGKAKFSRLFPQYSDLGSRVVEVEEAEEEEEERVENEDAMDVDEKGPEINEEELFKQAVDNYNPTDPPIDFRLLNGEWENEANATEDSASFNLNNQVKLDRISSLLESLYKQQHIRLAISPPPPQRLASASPSQAPATPVITPDRPTELEIMLYNDTVKELAQLVSELPPHLVASINGEKDGGLMLSSIIPLSTGSDVWKGTLPSFQAVKTRPPMNGYPPQSPRVSTPVPTGMVPNGIPAQQMYTPQQIPQQYHPQAVRVPVNVPAPPPPSQPQQYHTSRMPQQAYAHQQPVMTPQQPQYSQYHRHTTSAAPPLYTPTPYNNRAPQPVTPQATRVMSPITPTVHSQTPQPQLYHTHSYPGQPQIPQRAAPVPQTPQPQTPHYMQGPQPPPPRIIGPVNAPTPVPLHHQPHPQQYIPAPTTPQPQPVYHQHSLPQTSQQPGTPVVYHHYHHVIRNPYGQPQQGTPVAQMGGATYMQPQPQAGYVQQQQRGMNVPPPQGLAAVGYGVAPTVPQMGGVPGTPTPVGRYQRK